jgi:hypothetical protein
MRLYYERTLHYKVYAFIVAAYIGEVICAWQAVGPLNVAGPSLAVFLAYWGCCSSVLLRKPRIWI